MIKLAALIFNIVFYQVIAEKIIPVHIENVIKHGIVPDTAQSAQLESRIVSGWQAQPGQHPHQVSLRAVSSTGGVSGCGGTLIHALWMLTAAHCTASSITLVIRAGVTHMMRPQYISETTEYYNYPTYNNSRPREVQPDDISIVRLRHPAVFSDVLKAIRVQPSSEAFKNYDNEKVVASGFGRLWTEGASTETLHWVYLRAVSNPTCKQTFHSSLITQNIVCARYYNVTSQSVCQGDNGGPLVSTGADGISTLIGISSFVAGREDGGCHSGHPAAFTRPGPYHSWFRQITGIDFNNMDEIYPPTTIDPEDDNDDSEEDDNDDSEEDDSEIDDPEMEKLLKRLEVEVKVKVKFQKIKKRRRIHHETEL